jgi:capsular polysaccharide biosynthesis protein
MAILSSEPLSNRKKAAPADLAVQEYEASLSGRPLAAVVEYADVSITSEGILFRDGKIMGESFARAENFRRWKRKRRNKRYEQQLSTRTTRSIERVVWVTDDWSKGYFHWLADVLPKLAIAADQITTSTVLLPARFRDSKLVSDSLGLFGIADFEFINENETIVADRFYLPIHTPESGFFDEKTIRQVRRKFIDSLPGLDAVPDKRIYISRKHAKRRKVVNDDEVSVALAEFGFETVLAEELTFLQQVRLFASTRYLLSIHGAGLANMLFMPRGGRVMEFRKNDERASNCFLNMATALGHDFDYQTYRAEHEDQSPYTADLKVDRNLLEANLKRLLRKK